MNPQQHYPHTPAPAPTPEQNPYDFIMNSGAPQKPQGAFNLPAGKSSFQRVLFVVGGLLLLLIIGLVFMSLLGGGGGGSSDQLLSIAQEQTEMVRIATEAKNEPTARLATTQDLAANVSISIAASEQQIVPLIKTSKLQAKLTLKKSAATDARLATAAENDQYDETFTEVMNTELKTYQADIKKLYTTTKGTKLKAILAQAYNGAGTLLKEPSPPPVDS